MEEIETEDLTLAQVLRNAIEAAMLDVHTAIPGHVVRAGGTKVNVEIDIKRRSVTGDFITLPVLEDVPVIIPRSARGEAYLQMPLSVGDTGLIIFCERNLDDWKDDGQVVAPAGEDDRKFDYSDAVFIPGLYPFTKELKVTSSVKLANKSALFEMTSDSKISIGNSQAELLTILYDLLDILQAMQVATPAGPGYISPQDATKIITLQQTLARLKK